MIIIIFFLYNKLVCASCTLANVCFNIDEYINTILFRNQNVMLFQQYLLILFCLERAVQRTAVWVNCSLSTLHGLDSKKDYIESLFLEPYKICTLTFKPSVQKCKDRKAPHLQGQQINFTNLMIYYTKVHSGVTIFSIYTMCYCC